MQADVDYVVTNSDWDSNFKDAKEANPKVKFVRPTFIQACFDENILISPKKHSVTQS